MSPILWKSSIRYMVRHPWQIILAVIGVALGVAIVVSVDLARESANYALKLSTETIAGKSTHQITGPPGGLMEDVYLKLRMDGKIRPIAPVLEGYGISSSSGKTFHIMGIDFFADRPFRPYFTSRSISGINISPLFTEPGTVLLSSEISEEMNLKEGDRLEIKVGGIRNNIKIIGIITPENDLSRESMKNLIITDMATAQELLNKRWRLSWIDLIIPEGYEGEKLLSYIRDKLPQGYKIIPSGSKSYGMANLTRAFNLNLISLGLLALIVGMFLIYNTMTFTVVQRRTIIGMLRAVGVTRREIFNLIIGEALLIGFIGTMAGLLLGIILGKGMVKLVTRAINDIYFVLTVTGVKIAFTSLIKGSLLGIIASFIAAFVPAIEATSSPPRSVISRSAAEKNLHNMLPWITITGIILMITASVLLLLPYKSLILSLISLFTIILGFTLTIPYFTVILVKLINPVMGYIAGITGKIASRGIGTSLSRTSVAIAALTVAVAITVGVSITVGSLRLTVETWMKTLLRADIYITPPTLVYAQTELALKEELVNEFCSVPGIMELVLYRGVMINTPKGLIQLVAMNIDPKRNEAFRFKEGNIEEIWPVFDNEDGVIISDPYAYRYDTKLGDFITLPTDRGEKSFKVAGIFYDYSADLGVVIMHRKTYEKYWNDKSISSIGIYKKPEADLDKILIELQKRAGQEEILIHSNMSLRETTLAVFDRIFKVTEVLRLLAMIVAFVGVLSSLMALQLERTKELAVLRANGMTPREIWAIITLQTSIIGLISGLLAAFLGVIMASVLIYVINRQSFGWSMEMHLTWKVFIEGFFLAIIASALAGLYPGAKMASTPPAQALRED